MKKQYFEPVAELTTFQTEDILTISVCTRGDGDYDSIDLSKLISLQ